ncbi:uncharacterized protein [Heptranchias perlo]|uniref:uncharacterized protein isoform X2 n=1 Tax=Heptranchias perlo TaxID=212740 RepID=UPI00355A84A2
MQNKQLHRNPSLRNMTGIYLGMEGASPRFGHISAVPPLFRRRSIYRAKTSMEFQRFPKVKSVSAEVELHPRNRTKPILPSAEELRRLTRKVLRDFGIPRQSNSDKMGRRNKSSGFLNSPRKPPNSTRQSNIQELSVVTNAGRGKLCDELCRVTLAKEERTRSRLCPQEVCESVVTSQSARSNRIRQPRSSTAQHLPTKCLQSSQAFQMTEQAGRAAKTYLQSTTEDKMLLPSACVSGIPIPLPRRSVPLGRVCLAGRWGHTETGFPGYKMPRLNTALRGDLISKSLELKQRTDGNDNNKQVPMAAPVNDTRAANGSGGMDASKSKSSHSVKVRSPFTSGARTSRHSEINDQCTGSKKQRQTDASEHRIEENFEEDYTKDLVVDVSDLTKVEDSQMPNFADEEDEETLPMDSTEQLAKQIEVIINLKTKVDSTDCSSEEDLQQMNSGGTHI